MDLYIQVACGKGHQYRAKGLWFVPLTAVTATNEATAELLSKVLGNG